MASMSLSVNNVSGYAATSVVATGVGTAWQSNTAFFAMFGSISNVSVNVGQQTASFTYTPPAAFNPSKLLDVISDSFDSATSSVPIAWLEVPTTAAQPMPGLLDPTSVMVSSTTVLPSAPFTTLAGAGTNGITFSQITSMATNYTAIVIGDAVTKTIYVLNMSGVQQAKWTVAYTVASVSVDPSGNVYVLEPQAPTNNYTGVVHQYSPTGTFNWSTTVPHTADWGCGWQSSGSWYFLCNQRSGGSALASQLINTDSTLGSTSNIGFDAYEIRPHFGCQVAGGDIAISDSTHYVTSYDGSGTQIFKFGSSGGRFTQATNGWNFSLLAGAVRMTDGTFYVLDGGDGFYRFDGTTGAQTGFISKAGFGVVTSPYDPTEAVVDEYYPFISDGTNFYFSSSFCNGVAGAQLISVSRTMLDAMFSYPQEHKYRNTNLGPGAAILTGAPANYFTSNPHVSVYLDSWWGNLTGISANYRITSYINIPSQQQTTSWTPLSLTMPSGGNSSSTPIPNIPSNPGAYFVEVQLLHNNVAISEEALWYGVGIAGSTFNYSTLSSYGGPSYGGCFSSRSVDLNDEIFGSLGVTRDQFSWASCLTTATGTPNFSSMDTMIQNGANEAALKGQLYYIQVMGGSTMDVALVNAGINNATGNTWLQDQTTALVNHYKTLLGANKIACWECWNEPNNSYQGGSVGGSNFATNVMAPFYAGVKAADATANVVGPATLKLDFTFLNAFASNNGLSYCDIVSFHPYTEFYHTFEEEGNIEAVNSLLSLMAANASSGKQIWCTEMGYSNQIPTSIFGQAEQFVRTMLWGKILGITKFYAYVLEGNAADGGGEHYGIIEFTDNNSPVYMQPSGYACMTAKSLIANRPLVSQTITNAPHVYAVLLGGSDHLVAAWSDDAPIEMQFNFSVASTIVVHDVFGNPTTYTNARQLVLTVNQLPVYLEFPSGVNCTVAPYETFGTNLNLAGAVSVSSTNPNTLVSCINDGISDAQNGIGTLDNIYGWAQNVGDIAPYVIVTFASSQTVNRVWVGGHSVRSSFPGLRSYKISTKVGGVWTVQATITNQYYKRSAWVTFPAIANCQAVRIDIQVLNYGGASGGSPSWFWYIDAAHPKVNTLWNNNTAQFYPPALLYEFEAYAPGISAAVFPPSGVYPNTSLFPTSGVYPPTAVYP